MFTTVLLTACAAVSATTSSPYPASSLPASELFVVSEKGRSAAELLLLDSLAGNLARESPRIYRVEGSDWSNASSQDSYSNFLSDLSRTGRVRVNEALLRASAAEIVEHWTSAITGWVRCNASNASVSAALTFAAAGDGILVAGDEATAALLGTSLTLLRDLRGASVSDVLTAALPRLSKRVIVFQDELKSQFLGDYAIFSRAATMEFGGSDAAAQAALLVHTDGAGVGAVLGWGPENSFVSSMSAHSLWVHASDFAKNLAALANVAPAKVERRRPGADGGNGGNSGNGSGGSVHVVSFVFTDGDNLQWTLGPWSTDARWFGSARRGTVPLGWTFSPACAFLAPSVLELVLEGRTAMDELVVGPSGVGYTFPSQWPAETAGDFASLTHRGMRASEMSCINVIGVDDAEPDDADLAALLADDVADGLLYYSFGDGYSAFAGKMWWIGGKPVMTGRYSLWGEETLGPMLGVQGMIDALTALPCRDPTSSEAYSVVPVHAWSHDIDDVLAVAAALEEAGGFEVVLPSELLRRVKENVVPGR